MAFAPVCLSPDAPRLFRKFSQQKIERQFLEPVHQLMRRGVQRCAPQTTFEVTIVNNLLAVISGLSALGYVQKGNDSGVRFRQVLLDHYPWSCEPVQISDRAIWVEALFFAAATHSLIHSALMIATCGRSKVRDCPFGLLALIADTPKRISIRLRSRKLDRSGQKRCASIQFASY